MDTAPSPSMRYERLKGSGHRRIAPEWLIILMFFVIGIFALLLRGARVRLWRGPDHLLLVESDGYRERYKRFRFADIQCITLQQTSQFMFINAACAFLMVTFLVFTVITSEAGLRWFFAIVAAIWAVVLAFNLYAGPTCRCLLRTAVQTEELAPLQRLKNARAALDLLRPLIAQAQGPMPGASLDIPEDIPLPQTGSVPSADAQPPGP